MCRDIYFVSNVTKTFFPPHAALCYGLGQLAAGIKNRQVFFFLNVGFLLSGGIDQTPPQAFVEPIMASFITQQQYYSCTVLQHTVDLGTLN